MFSYPMQVDGTLTRILQAGLHGEPVILVHGTAARQREKICSPDVPMLYESR